MFAATAVLPAREMARLLGLSIAQAQAATELVVGCDDGPRTFVRTNDQPVRSIKAHRPRKTELPRQRT